MEGWKTGIEDKKVGLRIISPLTLKYKVGKLDRRCQHYRMIPFIQQTIHHYL